MEVLRLTPKQLAELRRTPTSDPNKVRLALKARRNAKQYELARAVGMEESHVSEIINGKYSRLSLDTARRIAAVFGACIEDIFPPACAARKKAA